MVSVAVDSVKVYLDKVRNGRVMDTLTGWQNVEDTTPQAVWRVRLRDGREMDATYTMGEWETLDGEQIIGVTHWAPNYVRAITPLYSIRDLWGY